MKMRYLIWTALLSTMLTACGGESFFLYSTSYEDGEDIPLVHSCNFYSGENISPHYTWFGAPVDTARYALIMDDEVPPCGKDLNACRHWGLFNIPTSVFELEEEFAADSIDGVTEGSNYTGATGYAGPCPPTPHTYTTTLYALSEGMPDIPSGSANTRAKFELDYAEYILGQSTLTGLFTPPTD